MLFSVHFWIRENVIIVSKNNLSGGGGGGGGRGRGEEEEENKTEHVTHRRNSNLKPDARHLIIIAA